MFSPGLDQPRSKDHPSGALSIDDPHPVSCLFWHNIATGKRESGIVELILRGKSNAQIEKELFISVHTVKNHITNIHHKLGVRSRWQLISLFHSGRSKRPSAAGPVPEMESAPERGSWRQ